MAFQFNPITGKFDLVNDVSATLSPNYQQTFVVGDWTGPVSGFYSLSIPGTTHGKGLHPIIQVYLLNGADYEHVELSISVNSSNGNITLGVTETPDERFEGKIIISEDN